MQGNGCGKGSFPRFSSHSRPNYRQLIANAVHG